jgi:hypothetical protein
MLSGCQALREMKIEVEILKVKDATLEAAVSETKKNTEDIKSMLFKFTIAITVLLSTLQVVLKFL